jgi:hypothetical protein
MGAYSFDGVDDILEVTGISSVSSPPITVFAQFRAAAIPSVDYNWWSGIVAAYNVTDEMFRLETGQRSDLSRRVAIIPRGEWWDSAPTQNDTPYSLETWHTAVGVWASETDRRSYLNGGDKGTSTASVLSHVATAIRVGRSLEGQHFHGHLGWVLLWNRGLSDAEIADLESGGAIPYPDDLIAAYNLTIDHGSGQIPDASGNGNHLTIYGATFDAGQTPPQAYTFGSTGNRRRRFFMVAG